MCWNFISLVLYFLNCHFSIWISASDVLIRNSGVLEQYDSLNKKNVCVILLRDVIFGIPTSSYSTRFHPWLKLIFKNYLTEWVDRNNLKKQAETFLSRLVKKIMLKKTNKQTSKLTSIFFLISISFDIIDICLHVYITNSSWHWGSYGSIWTGSSQKKNLFGPKLLRSI